MSSQTRNVIRYLQYHITYTKKVCDGVVRTF